MQTGQLYETLDGALLIRHVPSTGNLIAWFGDRNVKVFDKQGGHLRDIDISAWTPDLNLSQYTNQLTKLNEAMSHVVEQLGGQRIEPTSTLRT